MNDNYRLSNNTSYQRNKERLLEQEKQYCENKNKKRLK